jgi:hypothetical protein
MPAYHNSRVDGERESITDRRNTHIDAISFTPKHFFTSETIIFSFPLSPESPVSGTDTAGSEVSITSSWWDMVVEMV